MMKGLMSGISAMFGGNPGKFIQEMIADNADKGEEALLTVAEKYDAQKLPGEDRAALLITYAAQPDGTKKIFGSVVYIHDSTPGEHPRVTRSVMAEPLKEFILKIDFSSLKLEDLENG